MRLYIPFALIRFNACEAIEASYANLVVLSQLLVSLGLVVVASLVDLVTKGVLASGQTADVLADHEPKESRNICSGLPSANVDVAVLGNLLVGLLADTRGSALDGLSDVVDGLLNGLHCERVGWSRDERL